MGWARNTPLHVWGASGKTDDLGIAAICRAFEAAASWHVESKRGIVPSTGARRTIEAVIRVSDWSVDTLSYREEP